MKRLLPLLAVLLVLTSCSSREMTEPADTAEPERPETPQVQDTPVQTVAPSAARERTTLSSRRPVGRAGGERLPRAGRE